MPFTRDENEIGALWSKMSAKGEFFAGMVNGQAVVVFKNTQKRDGSKAPDWRILKAQPKPARDDEGPDF